MCGCFPCPALAGNLLAPSILPTTTIPSCTSSVGRPRSVCPTAHPTYAPPACSAMPKRLALLPRCSKAPPAVQQSLATCGCGAGGSRRPPIPAVPLAMSLGWKDVLGCIYLTAFIAAMPTAFIATCRACAPLSAPLRTQNKSKMATSAAGKQPTLSFPAAGPCAHL